MTRPGPRRPSSLTRTVAAALGLLSCLAPAPAGAQAVDCSALRAAVDAAASDAEAARADPARADAAMSRQRDEILRTRDYADRTGCGDGFFDDPDSALCRSLARRIGMLQVGLQRMQDQAARGDATAAADRRRRDLQARFDAQCTAAAAGTGTADAGDAGGAPAATMPVDPDAPPGPAAKPRAATVLCVRHCDGAFYPLAADVAPDRMADMDRICQAQCPSAASSAYAGGDGDVSGATATDGTAYSALPAAFGYLKGPVKTCSCRAPHQSWAEALAGAEALLQPRKGDVTVTAELSAAMARPAPPPGKPAPAGTKPTPAPAPATASRPGRAPKPKAGASVAVPAPAPPLDLTREFRGSDQTL